MAVGFWAGGMAWVGAPSLSCQSVYVRRVGRPACRQVSRLLQTVRNCITLALSSVVLHASVTEGRDLLVTGIACTRIRLTRLPS